MLRNKLICSMYLLVTAFSILTLYNSNKSFELKTEDRFVVTYVPNITGVCIYEPMTSNTMKCNLTTVSTIIHNMMAEDYFYIKSDNSEGHLLDILLSNDVEEYRIVYNRRTRDYICFSNPFLKNYVPATYIHE